MATGIEWADCTWNVLRGCTRVSSGCGGPHGQGGCYAERLAIRLSGPGQPYAGLIKSTPAGPRWTGEVRFVPELLDLPLRWRRPRRIFVDSMSDLFHEDVAVDWLNRIFTIMEASPQHTFLVLTKRARRMETYTRLRWLRVHPPNIWLGVSCETEQTYKQRVIYLARTPAALKFVSFEPLLGDLADLMLDGIYGGAYQWAIIGGESGPSARPFDLAWARSAIAQCRAAGVPVFVKQMGSHLHDGVWCWARDWCANHEPAKHCPMRDRKGGDPSEWPADLRVREWPERSR